MKLLLDDEIQYFVNFASTHLEHFTGRVEMQNILM